MPCMRHHARTKALAIVRQQSEQRAVNCDDDHASSTFVTMTASEDKRGTDEPDPNVAADHRNLSLEIAAENNFFHESRGGAQQNPSNQPRSAARSQQVSQLLGFLHLRTLCQSEEKSKAGKNRRGCNPKARRNPDINQK